MSSEQPKEFGKKYTPRAGGGASSSGMFSKTTPIFAKRNPVSSIQQSAQAAQQTPPPVPPAEASPLPEPQGEIPVAPATAEEISPLPSQKPLDPKLPPFEQGVPVKPLHSVLPGGIQDPFANPLPNRELLTPMQPIAPQPIASAPAPYPHLGEPIVSQQPQMPHQAAVSPVSPMVPQTPMGPSMPAAPKSISQGVSFAPDEKSMLATQRDVDNQVLIPAGTEVEGMIKTDRSLIIHGRIGGTGKNLGNLFTNGLIYISKTAKVEANIQCSRLEIYGNVDGEVIAREEVLLHKGGKLQGKVQTPHFKTEPGSFFKGTMEMTGSDVSVATAPSSAPPPTSSLSTRRPAA